MVTIKTAGAAVMGLVKNRLLRMMFIPVVPSGVEAGIGPFLVHVSDTPIDIYPFIRRVIQKINPSILVHTGDLVDNIKLSSNQHLLPVYQKHIAKFMDIINAFPYMKCYILPGNHDHLQTLIDAAGAERIISPGPRLFHGRYFYLSHDYPDADEITKPDVPSSGGKKGGNSNLSPTESLVPITLYGHRFTPKTRDAENALFTGKAENTPHLLNGLEKINIIDLGTGAVFHIPYPMDTNRYRKIDKQISGM